MMPAQLPPEFISRPPTLEDAQGIYEMICASDTAWFLAVAEGCIIGVALCNYRVESAWINMVSVRREWRRNGIATALLYHVFGEYYRRGKLTVGLGVDSQSLTGATHGYEQAGMHATLVFSTLQKVLRPAQSA